MITGLVRPPAGEVRLDGPPIERRSTAARSPGGSRSSRSRRRCRSRRGSRRSSPSAGCRTRTRSAAPGRPTGPPSPPRSSGSGVGHLLGRDARELSLGERQLVLLALAVAQAAPVLAPRRADGPPRPPPPGRGDGAARDLNERDGTAIVAVLHDLGLAALFFPRLVLIDRGRLVADGPPARSSPTTGSGTCSAWTPRSSARRAGGSVGRADGALSARCGPPFTLTRDAPSPSSPCCSSWRCRRMHPEHGCAARNVESGSGRIRRAPAARRRSLRRARARRSRRDRRPPAESGHPPRPSAPRRPASSALPRPGADRRPRAPAPTRTARSSSRRGGRELDGLLRRAAGSLVRRLGPVPRAGGGWVQIAYKGPGGARSSFRRRVLHDRGRLRPVRRRRRRARRSVTRPGR